MTIDQLKIGTSYETEKEIDLIIDHINKYIVTLCYNK